MEGGNNAQLYIYFFFFYLLLVADNKALQIIVQIFNAMYLTKPDLGSTYLADWHLVNTTLFLSSCKIVEAIN